MLNEVVSICKLVLVNPATSPGGGGGVCKPGNSWWGFAARFSTDPDPISGQKNVIFHTCFQTWPLGQIRAQTKNFFKCISNSHQFLLRPYSFGIETINTFIHSLSSLEIHTRFRTKNGQSVQYV